MIYDVTRRIRIDLQVRGLCKLPYPGHPKGCPCHGKRSNCPPQAPFFGDRVDLKKKMWFIVEEFDLASHKRKMLERHPRWTERQTANLLYWQGSVVKALAQQTAGFQVDHPGTISNFCPEAMGVNVFRTAESLRIPIERNPKNKVFKIALVFHPKITD